MTLAPEPRKRMPFYSRFGLAVVAAAGALTGCSAETPEPHGSGAAVGMVRVNWLDETRASWTGGGQRPLATTVWYPAAPGADEQDVEIPAGRPVFVGGRAARDALADGGFDLALVDIEMPLKSGIDVIAETRALPGPRGR
ncbi:MAG: hypothetical protein AAFX58_11055, partial [Pseudomonadota bacterium]